MKDMTDGKTVKLTSTERLGLLCVADVEASLTHQVGALRAKGQEVAKELKQRSTALAKLQEDRAAMYLEVIAAHDLDPSVPLERYNIADHLLSLKNGSAK